MIYQSNMGIACEVGMNQNELNCFDCVKEKGRKKAKRERERGPLIIKDASFTLLQLNQISTHHQTKPIPSLALSYFFFLVVNI